MSHSIGVLATSFDPLCYLKSQLKSILLLSIFCPGQCLPQGGSSLLGGHARSGMGGMNYRRMALSDRFQGFYLSFWMPHQRFMATSARVPNSGEAIFTKPLTTNLVDRQVLSNTGRTKITSFSVLETPNKLCTMCLGPTAW
jgi:hypothetical protein